MPKIYLGDVEKPSYLKAIRAKCLECSETSSGVRDCHIVKCPLWPYRFGKGIETTKNYFERHGCEVVMVDVKKVDYVEQLTKSRKKKSIVK